MVPIGTVVLWRLPLCKFAHAVCLGRCRALHPRCDILHLEPALPARPHHHTYAAGHFCRPQLPVRLAHVDRLAGVRCLSSSHNGKSWNFVRRGTPPVKRGVACSMLLSIDRTTHVHVSVRSVRRARGSRVSHGHRATPHGYCIVVMLLRRCTRGQMHLISFYGQQMVRSRSNH